HCALHSFPTRRSSDLCVRSIVGHSGPWPTTKLLPRPASSNVTTPSQKKKCLNLGPQSLKYLKAVTWSDSVRTNQIARSKIDQPIPAGQNFAPKLANWLKFIVKN